MLYLGIAGAVVALLIVVAIVLYNKLVKARNLVQAAWADIDVNLQKRYTLVPNLVTLARGYAAHEAALLEQLVKTRSSGQSRGKTAEQDGSMTGALRQFTMAVENYPDLKADGPFLELMESLAKLEDHLEYARKFYNGTTRSYNTAVQSFPATIIAGLFGFRPAEFYEIDTTGRAVPVIDNLKR